MRILRQIIFVRRLFNRRSIRGFTLAEIMVAASISFLLVGGALLALVHGLLISQKQSILTELNFNLEIAMDRIRDDLRLSSIGIGLMSFYPTNANEYSAISIPISLDLDNDGLLDRDPVTGKIRWNQTVIYHVRPGNPDKLYRTVFFPRYPNATPAMIYEQLRKVAISQTDGEIQAACLPGENVSSRIIFENLVKLRFKPPSSSYDCYSPILMKEDPYTWGSIVLGPGYHELTFEVIGKNPASTGYKIGIDNMALSWSLSRREGELFYPIRSRPSGSENFEYSISGSGSVYVGGYGWGGDYILWYNPVTAGNKIKFKIYNDLWCDSDFNEPGGIMFSNCSVKLDYSFTSSPPYIADFVISMDKGITWSAAACGSVVESFPVTNISVQTYIYATNLVLNGCWTRFFFERDPKGILVITNAYIRDVLTGVSSNITFGKKRGILIPVDGPTVIESDWVQMWEIIRNKSYIIGFEIPAIAGDADYDMFIGSKTAGKLWFYENTGTMYNALWKAPVAGWQNIKPAQGCKASFCDIDGDGDYDLFLGVFGPYVKVEYYKNTGSIQYPNMVLTSSGWINYTSNIKDASGVMVVPNRPYVTMADIDGDGDYDMFIGERDGQIKFYRNIGNKNNPVWASPDSFWQGIQVYANDNPSSYNNYISIDFADIDGDGDLDLFVGRESPGDILLFVNTGNINNPVFGNIVITNYGGFVTTGRSCPALVDIDADGDLDMFIGQSDGTISFYRNIGTKYSALWASPFKPYYGIDLGDNVTVTFCNIDRTVVMPARWQNLEGIVMSKTNGIETSDIFALSVIEVGYPRFAYFRSGIYDTQQQTPEYERLDWTEVQLYDKGGDVDLRVRTGNMPDLSDVSEYEWSPWFQGCLNNSLSTLPKRRYIQYEARFECGRAGIISAHTNIPTAILRDVTIRWKGKPGLVDLKTQFAKGPDCGIVSAKVDDKEVVKAIEVDMTIFKRGRLGMNTVHGRMLVRPLNTGK